MLNRYLNWAVLLVVVCPGAVAAAENVEREMIRRAPDIVQTLQKRGYHNVGVLKFLVAKGKGNLSDNTGTLNLTLANRLEIALILKDNPARPPGDHPPGQHRGRGHPRGQSPQERGSA